MGNRAMIVFDMGSNSSDALPCVYLHWNGGPESVYTFLDYTRKVCREGDTDYLAARFVQIVGNFFGGNTSLGLSATTREAIKDLDPGDNGIYVVDGNLKVIKRMHDDYVDDPAEPRGYKRVEVVKTGDSLIAERILAASHQYNKDGSLMEQIAQKNDAHFAKELAA